MEDVECVVAARTSMLKSSPDLASATVTMTRPSVSLQSSRTWIPSAERLSSSRIVWGNGTITWRRIPVQTPAGIAKTYEIRQGIRRVPAP